VYAFMEQHGSLLWAIVYLGVSYPLFFRWQGYLVAYLRHFPHVDGVPLDKYHGGNGPNYFSPFARAVRDAKGKRQADPELERMRREVRRRFWQFCPLGCWFSGAGTRDSRRGAPALATLTL